VVKQSPKILLNSLLFELERGLILAHDQLWVADENERHLITLKSSILDKELKVISPSSTLIIVTTVDRSTESQQATRCKLLA
jgi:hypothetical protein